MRVRRLGRLILPALVAIALISGLAEAGAQEGASTINPTAQPVTEQQLLDELNKIEGRVTLPIASRPCSSSRKA